MTIVDADAADMEAVHDYLGRLHEAAWGLVPARRDELVAEVQEHIVEALRAERAAGNNGAVAVRNVLERLGPPEEIARAAVEQEMPASQAQPPPHPAPQSTNLRDISTVLLLMFGGFVVGIGWVVGVALLWSSTRWRTRDKWLATLVWPFGYVGVFALGTIAVGRTSSGSCTPTAVQAGLGDTTCTGGGGGMPGWLGFLIFLVVVVAPVLVAVRLLRTPSTPTVGAARP